MIKNIVYDEKYYFILFYFFLNTIDLIKRSNLKIRNSYQKKI